MRLVRPLPWQKPTLNVGRHFVASNVPDIVPSYIMFANGRMSDQHVFYNKL